MHLSTQEEHCLHLGIGKFRCKENSSSPKYFAFYLKTHQKKKKLNHLEYSEEKDWVTSPRETITWWMIYGFRDVDAKKDHLLNLIASNRWKGTSKRQRKNQISLSLLNLANTVPSLGLGHGAPSWSSLWRAPFGFVGNWIPKQHSWVSSQGRQNLSSPECEDCQPQRVSQSPQVVPSVNSLHYWRDLVSPGFCGDTPWDVTLDRTTLHQTIHVWGHFHPNKQNVPVVGLSPQGQVVKIES